MAHLFAQIKNGLYMATQSFSMLWQQKKLLFYFSIPALISFAIQLMIYNIALPDHLFKYGQDIYNHFSTMPYFIKFVASFFVVYISAAIMTFFTVALVHHIAHIMQGQTTTIKESLKSCLSKIKLILAWSLPAAFVEYFSGTLLEVGQYDLSYTAITLISLGSIIAVATWFLYTFYVTPLIAFKNLTLMQTINLSGKITRFTFIELVGGQIWFGIVIFLVLMPVILLWLLSQQIILSPMLRFVTLFITQIIIRACISSAHTIFKIILYTQYLKTHQETKEHNAHFPKYF